MPYMLDGRQLNVGRSFKTTDGVSYSQLWNTQLTDEEKTAIGITYEADPAPFDETYYFSAGNPRPLDDGTDSDGNKFTGIRASFVKEQKRIAALFLSDTDWYVVRKSEKDTDIPSNVITYRDAVRTACAARETEIAAVSSTEALETLMKTAPGESGALTQWPVLAS